VEFAKTNLKIKNACILGVLSEAKNLSCCPDPSAAPQDDTSVSFCTLNFDFPYDAETTSFQS
jgi:hypothetical protein